MDFSHEASYSISEIYTLRKGNNFNFKYCEIKILSTNKIRFIFSKSTTYEYMSRNGAGYQLDTKVKAIAQNIMNSDHGPMQTKKSERW